MALKDWKQTEKNTYVNQKTETEISLGTKPEVFISIFDRKWNVHKNRFYFKSFKNRESLYRFVRKFMRKQNTKGMIRRWH